MESLRASWFPSVQRLLTPGIAALTCLACLGAAPDSGVPGGSPAARSEAAIAEPGPGAVFREYLWTNREGDAGGALRVGGRLDYGGGPIVLPHDLDLDGAIGAEVLIEKLLCHDGTRGLAVSINSNAWVQVPEAAGIPEPQWDYMHHTCQVVPVPLQQLRPGTGNHVRLRVSPEHPWNWPQHLLYGIHVRISYDPALKPHPSGRVMSPRAGDKLGAHAVLEVEASSPNSRVRQVDFIGHHLDVNLEGDGEYTRWHYRFHRAVFTNHLGSATTPPWRVAWDNSWVPDQPTPFRIAARIIDDSGLVYFSEAVDGLTFQRAGWSVELCPPYDVPKKWLTRTGEHSQKFRVTGDPSRAVAAQLVWTSWSPGYMEGLFLNDRQILLREGPRYACHLHRVTLGDLGLLEAGENVLRTGMTPLYDGQTVHGMELNWPGIMVLIRYRQ